LRWRYVRIIALPVGTAASQHAYGGAGSGRWQLRVIGLRRMGHRQAPQPVL